MSKLDWMYKTSSTVDPEDYLLGKAIDKNFETQASSTNEVDKDILPASIFATAHSTAPVDIVRKIKEDPLEQIKQKEIEMRKQLLKNPVKLKKLQNMLKAKAEQKERKKKKKSKNKELDDRLAKLLQKYGTKKVMDLTKSDDSEEERKSRQGSRKRNTRERSESSSSSDNKSRRDRRKRSGDRSSKYNGKKKSRRRSSSDNSDDRKSRKSGSDRRTRDGRRHQSESEDDRSRSRNRKDKVAKEKSVKAEGLMSECLRLIEKHGAKKLMELISDDSDDDKKNKSKKRSTSSTSESDMDVRSSKSRANKQSSKRKNASDNSSSEDEKRSKTDDAKNAKQSTKYRKRQDSSSSDSSDDNVDVQSNPGRRRQHSSDDEKSPKKAYGLVLPKGVETKPKSRPAAEPVKKVEDKPKFVRHKPSKLTEKEKAAKLKEMMANAEWRDKERKTNVAKYRAEDKKEADSQNYDEGFMRKQLAKAVDSSKSVEERIKSRMNSVQRSKLSMSQNFARRH